MIEPGIPKPLKYAGSREVSTFFGLASALFAALDNQMLAWITAALALASLITGIIARRKEVKIRRNQSSEFITVALTNLGKSLELASYDAQWRLGFYEQRVDGSWCRLGRYCPDRRLNSGGRASLPLGQGVLRDATKGSDKSTGRTEVFIVPNYCDDPQGWFSAHCNQGLTQSEIKALRFRPCTYIARIFTLESSVNVSRVVAFVAESESQSITQRINTFEGVLTRDIAELTAMPFSESAVVVLTEMD